MSEQEKKHGIALLIARRLSDEWDIGHAGMYDDTGFERATDEEIAAVIQEMLESTANAE